MGNSTEHILKVEELRDDRNLPPRRIVKTTEVISPSTEDESHSLEAKKAIFRASQVVWFITGIIEILLGFRILLKFIGANPASAFTQTIYFLSDPFALPFSGIVKSTISGFSVMEWSSFVAMAVYAVVAWGIIEFFHVVKPIGRQEMKHAI